jgi:hypothetical protein
MTYTDKSLLLAEWACPPSACPVCGNAGTHQIECAMDLALSERGFYTREERERARAFIKGQLAPTLPPEKP